jgi:hypothetical protein
MTKFHAVMIDETGYEFGVDIEADSREAAYDQLGEDYPESSVDQLETRSQSSRRERDMYAHIEAGGDWDDEGRPIFHYSNRYEDDDD